MKKAVVLLLALSACSHQLREPIVEGVDEECLAELSEKMPAQTNRISQAVQARSLVETCDLMRFRKNPVAYCPEWSSATFTSCLQQQLHKQIEGEPLQNSSVILLQAMHITWFMQFRKAEKSLHSANFFPFHLVDFTIAALETKPPPPGATLTPASDEEKLALLSLQEDDRKARATFQAKAKSTVTKLLAGIRESKPTPAEKIRLAAYEKRLSQID